MIADEWLSTNLGDVGTGKLIRQLTGTIGGGHTQKIVDCGCGLIYFASPVLPEIAYIIKEGV